jgi:hypothetical protein
MLELGRVLGQVLTRSGKVLVLWLSKLRRAELSKVLVECLGQRLGIVLAELGMVLVSC